MTHSNLQSSRLEGVNFLTGSFGQTRRIIASDITMDPNDPVMHFFDPGGVNRTITLPPIGLGGLLRIIQNLDSSATLTVKDNLGTTIGSVPFGDGGVFVCSEKEWKLVGGAASSTISGIVSSDSSITSSIVGLNFNLVVNPAHVDHDLLLHWVANKHIDHSTVSVNLPAAVFTGYGDITTTRTVSFVTQTQKTFFAGPTSGADATPAFRALAAADVPPLAYVTSVGIAAPLSTFTTSGTPVTSSGTLTLAFATQVKNTVLSGPTSGADAAPTWRSLVPNDITLTNTHILVGNSSALAADVAMSGDATIDNTGALTVANNAISNAKFRQGVARSVVGVTGNATANEADIQGTANQVLLVNSAGTALAFTTLSGDVTNATGVVTIANNVVTDAKFRQGVARSVVGVTGNATANTADIQGTANQVLLVNSGGTALAFTTLSGDVTNATGVVTIANNAVSNAKLRQGTGLSVIGVTGSATANEADIVGTADQCLIVNHAGTALAFTTLSGDVTNATGVMTIANNVVTDAKFRQGVARSVVGVTGNATANTADIQGTANQVLLVNSGGTALAFTTLSGDVTNATGVVTIANNAVSNAKFRQGAGLSLVGVTGSATANVADLVGTANQIPIVNNAGTALAFTTLSGDITNATGVVTIANNAVTDAKFRQGAAHSVVGVTGNATANTADITGTASQILRINSAGTALAFGSIDISQTASVSGVLYTGGVPAFTGDVTSPGSSLTLTIAAGAVTYAKMQNVSATSRILGRKTAGAGSTEELTLSDALDFVGSAAQGDVLYRGASTWTRLGAGSNGQVLTTGGAAANPSWTTVGGTGTVQQINMANGLSSTQSPLTTIGTMSVLGIHPPTGRLTLTASTPVLNANTTGQGTIYYTPYVGLNGTTANATSGPWVPSYNGTNTVMVDVGGELSYALNATPHLTGKIYDFFWDDAGARLVTGPAWTNNTTRASALAYKNGYLTNSASMTGVTTANGASPTIAANRGLYLGTIRTTAAAQTGMNFQPAAASGGPTGGAVLGVYNAYNKVACSAYERDTVGNASYSMTSTTWQVFGAAGGNTNNAISWIDGLGDVPVAARFTSDVAGGATSGAAVIGIDFNDSTSAAPDFMAALYNSTGTSNIAEGTATSMGEYLPVLGYNTIYPKTASYNTNSMTFYGGTGFGGPVADAMQFKATMWM